MAPSEASFSPFAVKRIVLHEGRVLVEGRDGNRIELRIERMKVSGGVMAAMGVAERGVARRRRRVHLVVPRVQVVVGERHAYTERQMWLVTLVRTSHAVTMSNMPSEIVSSMYRVLPRE